MEETEFVCFSSCFVFCVITYKHKKKMWDMKGVIEIMVGFDVEPVSS